ncbi:MAG: lamin tail domain-containing protein [Planctomycetes bacterium]|nr:lamin tail domain-containing protein [Planctomycetota bacterium]
MEHRGFRGRALPVACTVLVAGGSLPAAVRVSEVMYNSPHGSDYEYVELTNDGAEAVELAGWAFTDGIELDLPAGARLEAGAYAVVCRSREALRRAYPELPDGAILGEYEGSLANEGETLALAGPGGAGEAFAYDDDPPWDFLADGFGASLERACMSSDPALPSSWRAGPVPGAPELHGGSPGTAGLAPVCPPVDPPRPRVFLSEVHYHPVLEQALEDEHEFIEIHNAGAEAVALRGWRLAGGIDFAFPEGASIAPGAYRVVAKSRAKLAAVAAYGLGEAEVLGDYARELDNGGDKVALIGAEGQGIDSMSYDDDFPWPVGADALGADEPWLKPELLPLEPHRYLGHSLERVSFERPAGELANWAPSKLDGPTPGRPNGEARAEPLPIVDALLAAPEDGGELIRSDQPVRVQAQFAPRGPSGPVEIEHYVDDVILGGEKTVLAAAMTDDGKGADLIAGDGVYAALLPGKPDNTVVRYRIRADRGAGVEVVSPRPSDPNGWYAWFVSPEIETRTRVYQVLISPVNWGRMWTGIQSNRVSGCNLSPTWDKVYPAVLVYDGRVMDAFVRYQGSRWNRTNGPAINAWPFPRPQGGPSPLRALSWRIELPRYEQVDGESVLLLNKLTQGCPGYNAGVGYRLFEAAGLPGSRTRFIRFHVNGGYYHYMIQLERGGEEMMRRYHREMAEAHPGQPRERVGHLFKSAGCNCDEGPYGWGDERVLLPFCGHPKEARYAATYDRKTHGWASYDELIRLIEDLSAARRAGPDALREYFAERFDLDLLLDYVAIMNWSVPFDDMFQNHFLYQRLSDGKWLIFPWDLDQNFGEWKPANASLYMGEQGDPDNRSGWWNYVKDSLLKSYRPEYEDRLLLLNNTILHPDNIARLVDEVTAVADPAEAAKAPAGVSCSFPGRATSFKAFAVTRYNLVNQKLAGVDLDAGPDQTVYAGTIVQFDARASRPEPGEGVTYRWSNGMEGSYPTAVFDAPGVHAITLIVTVRGIELKDSVTITVLPRPEAAFVEKDGIVVLEAESFSSNERNGATTVWWDLEAASAGFSGAGYMKALESKRTTFLQRYVGVAPELRYAVLFERPGAYRVWLRALNLDTSADSCYVGLGGLARSTRWAHQFAVDPSGFAWGGDSRLEGPQQVQVERPGLQLFSVYVRESGQVIDKVLLTLDTAFAPQGAGPPESGKAPLGGGKAFVRGDASPDGKVNVSDAIRVLLHLFGGAALACLDAADADDTGKLDLTDAVYLLQYLFQRGPVIPQPFPEAGPDPTPDELECEG